MSNPFLGAGLAATRYIDEVAKSRNPSRPDVATGAIPDGLNQHSHNIFLQTWHELGAIGAGILALLGFSLVAVIGRMTPTTQPFALATMTAAIAIASLSWSLISVWFMASLGLTAMVAQLIENDESAAAARRTDEN